MLVNHRVRKSETQRTKPYIIRVVRLVPSRSSCSQVVNDLAYSLKVSRRPIRGIIHQWLWFTTGRVISLLNCRRRCFACRWTDSRLGDPRAGGY